MGWLDQPLIGAFDLEVSIFYALPTSGWVDGWEWFMFFFLFDS